MLKRIDSLGVTEPTITVEGKDKIRVQLACITNEQEARNMLMSAANLTFRDTKDNYCLFLIFIYKIKNTISILIGKVYNIRQNMIYL